MDKAFLACADRLQRSLAAVSIICRRHGRAPAQQSLEVVSALVHKLLVFCLICVWRVQQGLDAQRSQSKTHLTSKARLNFRESGHIRLPTRHLLGHEGKGPDPLYSQTQTKDLSILFPSQGDKWGSDFANRKLLGSETPRFFDRFFPCGLVGRYDLHHINKEMLFKLLERVRKLKS